jgi:PAS domain S-box-containing protein
VNPAVEVVTGYPPEAFLANPDTAIQVIHEDDRPRVSQAMATGSEEPITARLVRADGATCWVEYRNFSFYNPDNQIVAICGTVRDITVRVEALEALRRSEQYRSALLRAMPDTVFRLDSAGNLLDYVSGEATEAFPGASGELIGRNVRELLPHNLATPILEVTRAALRSGRLQRTEFDVSSPNQTMIYEARCLPFDGAQVLLILRDFTAVKWHEAEEDRKRFRDELDMRVERKLPNPYNLTYRELAILHLVVEGQADKQIADSLGISTYTVNKHVGNILAKMAAASRTEAGVRAIREGLVS